MHRDPFQYAFDRPGASSAIVGFADEGRTIYAYLR